MQTFDPNLYNSKFEMLNWSWKFAHLIKVSASANGGIKVKYSKQELNFRAWETSFPILVLAIDWATVFTALAQSEGLRKRFAIDPSSSSSTQAREKDVDDKTDSFRKCSCPQKNAEIIS